MSPAARHRCRCRRPLRRGPANLRSRWPPSPLPNRCSNRRRYRRSRPMRYKQLLRRQPRPRLSRQNPLHHQFSRRRKCRRCRGWSEKLESLTSESFRGAQKARTLNLEIPRCAIAHLRSGPSDHPGMTTQAKNFPIFRGVFCGAPPSLLLPPGSSQNQIGDFSGMRRQRQMTCIHLHGGRIHAFRHEPFEVGVDRLIEFRHRIP
jgi:hypothetical protein